MKRKGEEREGKLMKGERMEKEGTDRWTKKKGTDRWTKKETVNE